MRPWSGRVASSVVEGWLEDGVLTGDWVLVESRSDVRLKSRGMWGLARVRGVFREVSGSGTVSADGKVSGIIRAAAASIDTSNSLRDRHLRSAEFFDSVSYPDITFAAYGVWPSGVGGAVVTGELTVRDRTRLLTFDAAASAQADGEIGLDAVVRINRGDFGLTWNRKGLTSLRIVLTIRAVFTRR